MKKLLSRFLLVAFLTPLCLAAAHAAEEGGEGGGTPHYPLKHPEHEDWSFAGPFGTYDRGQLQRGLKVYRQVCSACHSLDLVAFRTLTDLGYSEAQVKALAAEYEIEAGPDDDGNMYMRPGIPSDYFPAPFENPEQAAASNNGAAPPDLSLMAKARGITRGFPTFIFDMFTQYQEGGPDYIHALLTGYEDPPEGENVPVGSYYNPYFANAAALAMAPPLSEGIVAYDDGAPETVDQYAKDISAFLMWTAEPKLEARKQLGLTVMVFLVILTALVYLTKKSVYASKRD
ncbi:cytochrome c1 [Martelella mediterranea]|uniref:Cytochrome c1 n=1 Tax=Martelella mediterranea TaxID=293089 RepID=A0A4R3NTE9_9HYPH|nr:cytochrome c1 [Martelella mediterranea]TCT40186.1 ubiquinol-cytochrome c reductase cytochrome c1 subunit [Martelella mediterranea]